MKKRIENDAEYYEKILESNRRYKQRNREKIKEANRIRYQNKKQVLEDINLDVGNADKDTK